MTAKMLGGTNPLVVVFNGLGPFFVIGGPQAAFAVYHNKDGFDTIVGAAFFQIVKVGSVLGFVFEKRVNVLDAVDAKFFFGDLRKIQICDFAASQRPVQRPFSQVIF